MVRNDDAGLDRIAHGDGCPNRVRYVGAVRVAGVPGADRCATYQCKDCGLVSLHAGRVVWSCPPPESRPTEAPSC